MTSKNLPWHGLTAQLFLKFLLITQQEVPFINTSEATMYRCHKLSKSCRLINPNLHKPLLQLQDARFVSVSIYTVPHIYGLNSQTINKQVHSYATRYASDFHLPFCRTNLVNFLSGPIYYNSLQNDIEESNSLHSFKKILK